MNCSVAVYQRRLEERLHSRTLGLGPFNRSWRGRNADKVERQLIDALRTVLAKIEPAELSRFRAAAGIRLERVPLELPAAGKRRKLSGVFPVVIEPRGPASGRVLIAYHPLRQDEWFVHDPALGLASQAQTCFQRAWEELSEEELLDLRSDKRDSLRLLSFSAAPQTILELLPEDRAGLWDDLVVKSAKGARPKRQRGSTLARVGVELTEQVIGGGLVPGVPRSPYREQLQLLLGGERKTPVLLVGPPGCGKSSLFTRLVADLAEQEGYALHRNRDRLHQVWRVSGKQIIAGMSYVGDWEQRCLEIIEDAKGPRRILLADDLHTWGRVGRTRESDSNLALFFQGPLARGEIALLGECTPEQLQRLEDDAPSFAALFTQVRVHPTDRDGTLRLVLHEARRLEEQHAIEIDPFVHSVLLDLSGALSPGGSFPGQALDLLREVARKGGTQPPEPDGPQLVHAVQRPRVGPEHVREVLSQRTGLPRALLEPGAKLDPAEVASALGRQVMGQPEAIEAAVDLVLRIRTGLVDQQRPYGVYLFSGPTGTGKTELAKSLAAWLYGSESRLLRFDMGELSGADAPARLIGDAFAPEGLLTRAAQAQPFCVVLLDEIEKAHPSVLHLLLQLFDEGRLTDAAGTVADFTHAVVVMTSNLGTRLRAPIGVGPVEIGSDADRAVREHFPPELFNRIDRVVRFRPLTAEVAGKVVEKELARLVSRRGLTARNVFVSFSEAVREHVVAQGFDAVFGARSLKRWLEEHIGALLTDALSAGSRASLQRFQLVWRDGQIQLEREALEPMAQDQASFALEELSALTAAGLRERLGEQRAALEELESGTGLAEVIASSRGEVERVRRGEAPGGDALHELEMMRNRIARARGVLEGMLGPSRAEAQELQELEQFAWEEVFSGRKSTRVKQFERRSLRRADGLVSRSALLEAHAEALFLRGAVARAGEPGAHSILIELVRIGAGRDRGRFDAGSSQLLAWLAGAYSDGVLERAALLPAGQIVSFDDAPPAASERVALHLAGPFVKAFYEGESGCHIWQSLGRLPEIVRVSVLPAEASVRELLAGARPATLAPVVRVYHFEPPAREGDSAPLELEDNLLGFAARLRVRSPVDALPALWRLRKTRVLR